MLELKYIPMDIEILDTHTRNHKTLKICLNCLRESVLKTDAGIPLPIQRCEHCGFEIS